jgi:hypothetical protein
LHRLDQESAAAAHRVEQWRARLPTGQSQDSRGKVFAQRRDIGMLAQAALEQRIAGSVQIQRHAAVFEKGVDADIRIVGVHAGAFAAEGAELVAYRILDFQCGEIQAFQRAFDRRHVDADRA